MLSEWKKYAEYDGYLNTVTGWRIEKVSSVIVTTFKEIPQTYVKFDTSNESEYGFRSKNRLVQKIVNTFFPKRIKYNSSSYNSSSSMIYRESKETDDSEWKGKWILRTNSKWEGPFPTAEAAAEWALNNHLTFSEKKEKIAIEEQLEQEIRSYLPELRDRENFMSAVNYGNAKQKLVTGS